VLQIVKEEKNIPHTAKRRKANKIGHMLPRNCRLEHVTCGKTARNTELIEDEEEDLSSHLNTGN
jgi:hypothetical protein